jgi:Family of unknown function (DUF6111)
MLRVFLEIILPLTLPTALYFLWIAAFPRDGAAADRTPPWVWLAGAGTLLLAIVLVFMVIDFGTAQHGVYVPPRWQNGRIVPGHIEPRQSAPRAGP